MMLKISIVLLSVLLELALAASNTNSSTAEVAKVQNDLKAKVKPGPGRAGRMLDLDKLAGDVSQAAAERKELSGNRQSRILSEDLAAPAEVEGRSRKGSGKKMSIKGFIPIVSVEGASQLSGSDSNSDEADESDAQQGNLHEHLASSFGGQTSMGHASFPTAQQQQPQALASSNEQQWQQAGGVVDPQQNQNQMFASPDPNQQEAARANRKLLGTSNIFNGMGPSRGFTSNLVPPSVPLGHSSGGYSPMSHPMHLLMNAPALPQSFADPSTGEQCVCVPFFQCKGGYLNEAKLSKGQFAQVSQLAASQQVPRSNQPTQTDLAADQAQAQAQQQQQQQQLTTSSSPMTNMNHQQQSANEFFDQFVANMQEGQFNQQMSLALIDERNARTGGQNSSQAEGEGRAMFGGRINGNRRNSQLQSQRCSLMRTCCKIPPRMLAGLNGHLSNARLVNPMSMSSQLIASPSVSRPLTSNQYLSSQQQQLAHRHLQMRPSQPALNAASEYFPIQGPSQNQDPYQAAQAASLSRPLVMESILAQQQQQQQQQLQQFNQQNQLVAANQLASVRPAGSFMAGRCGVRQTLGISGRVQNAPAVLEGGEANADFGEFPAHAAILKRISPGDSLFVCSAVLISSQWLATAAHCVRKHRPDELKVRLGEWDVNRDDEFYPFFESNIREIVINPEFQPSSLANDLALLRLEQPVDQQQMPHVAPACLAQPEETAQMGGQRCWVAGWGKNAFGQQGTFQSVLKKVDLPVVSHQDCELALKFQTKLGKFFRLHANNICAGGERGKDACEGDGGAGLYCLDAQSSLIKAVGLVSWGVGCGQRGVPGVYVNLANFNHWIEQVVLASGEENVYLDGRAQQQQQQANDFKSIISERTNEKSTNGTLADEQEERSAAGEARGGTTTTIAATTTTTTPMPPTSTTTSATPEPIGE